MEVRAAVEGWTRAGVASLAQLVFCSKPIPGVLVALGLAAFSPWMLAGAATGAAIGTVVERYITKIDPKLWRDGVGGINPAILGILGSGILAAGERRIVIFLLLLFLCALLAAALRAAFARIGLFALSAPAYLTAVLASLALAGPGRWWWTGVGPIALGPLGPIGPWLTVAFLVAAIGFELPAAAGWTMCVSLAVCLGSMLLGATPLDGIELWGIVVPLSAFGAQRLLAWRSPGAPGLAVIAALLSVAFWGLWHAIGLERIAPPLIAPAILTLSVMLYAYPRLARVPSRFGHPLLQTGFVRAVLALWLSRAQRRPILLITGSSEIEDSILRGLFGDSAEARDSVLQTRAGQRRLWEAADALRRAEKPACPDFRADLVLAGDCIGQGAPHWNRHDGAGRADRMRCTGCGMVSPAPPAGLWKRLDLRCAQCMEPVVPDIRKLVPLSPDKVRAELDAALPGCATGVILPGALKSPAAAAFLDKVRQMKWPLIQLVDDPGETVPGSIVIVGGAPRVLKLFSLLRCARRAP